MSSMVDRSTGTVLTLVMMITGLNGFRPEPQGPESDRHWSFADMKALIAPSISGLYRNLASDLRVYSSPRHQQLRTSTCVGQSMIKACENKRIQKHGHAGHVDLSRLGLYFLARELMNPPETHLDQGTYIPLAADALRRFGICPESDWPWDESKMFTPPTWSAMRKSYLGKISSWFMIKSSGSDRVEDVIANLAVGNPVVFGTVVGDNWMDYGRSSEPIRTVDGLVRGRHATVLLGWNPRKGVFYGENSWGAGWGVLPDFENEVWAKTAETRPSYTNEGGYYELRPEVVASSDSADFVSIVSGWEPWAKKEVA